jgi:hypothetical protein
MPLEGGVEGPGDVSAAMLRREFSSRPLIAIDAYVSVVAKMTGTTRG